MATVTSLTAARLLALEADTVIGGHIAGDNLILEQHDGSTIDAGNVRGPGSPSSATVVGDTTILRTSDGRGKVATPTAAEDATTKAYVDAINTSLDGRLDTLEGQTLDARLDVLEGQTLDARLDALEADTLDTRLDAIEAGYTRRINSSTTTTDGSLSASEINVGSVTIPNPINGARYRCTFHGNFISNGSLESRTRIKHGISAVTGGTQIAEGCLNHDATTRAMSVHITIEFTFTGTTGQANYNVVATHVPLSGQSRLSAASTRAAVLVVDRVA